MNVNELWSYRDAAMKVQRALDDLAEYESKIYSPSGARCNGMPFDPSGDNDRLAPIAEKHEELIQKLAEAKLEAHQAYVMLEEFEKNLSDEECEVFNLRYRKWFSTREISTQLFRSDITIKRAYHRIKEKFKRFEKMILNDT